MSIVKTRKPDLLTEDILPYVKFGPVADREDPEVFPEVFMTVEDIPVSYTHLTLPTNREV